MPPEMRVFGRLLKWRMEPRSRGRYRAFRDEFGYWIIATRVRLIVADKNLAVAKAKAHAIIEAEE